MNAEMKTERWYKIVVLTLAMVLTGLFGFAQGPTDELPPDPGSIAVYTVQDLSFGAFSGGATGGTVLINPSGNRSVTGTIIPLNMGVFYYQAIFEIDAPQGTIISILNGPNAVLSGSNGGTMQLSLGVSSPASPFVTTVAQPARTAVAIGGTLTVGNAASTPAGNYSGSFYVTFNQE